MENTLVSFPCRGERLNQLLTAHGILPTLQRTLIAEVLFVRRRHLSADQVLSQVNKGEQQVSKATVYNTLGLFAREGLIRELVVDPSRVFYDPCTEPHHHYYNVDTRELTDIPADCITINSLPEPPKGSRPGEMDVIVRVRNTN